MEDAGWMSYHHGKKVPRKRRIFSPDTLIHLNHDQLFIAQNHHIVQFRISIADSENHHVTGEQFREWLTHW